MRSQNTVSQAAATQSMMGKNTNNTVIIGDVQHGEHGDVMWFRRKYSRNGVAVSQSNQLTQSRLNTVNKVK